MDEQTENHKVNDKYVLITKDTQNVVGETDIIKKIISTRQVVVYWGTAPTGKVHIGYFRPLLKIKDLVDAGCIVKILIADLHAFLDNLKTPYELIDLRSQYYKTVLSAMLEFIGVNLKCIQFIKGTEFQLTPKYTLDVYKMLSHTTLSHAKHAGAEVVKQSENPLMTSLIYPVLQALDEEYLSTDIDFGGNDQIKILMYAREFLPKLKYKKRFQITTPMVTGLRQTKTEEKTENDIKENQKRADNLRAIIDHNQNNPKKLMELLEEEILIEKEKSSVQDKKMSSSNPLSKIGMDDSKKDVKTKINQAYCLPGDVEDNCLMEWLEQIVFPVLKIKQAKFVVNRKEEHGGNLEYDSFEAVKNDFANEKLHPADFKIGMVDAVNYMLNPVRTVLQEKDMVKMINKAYPPEKKK